MYTRSFIFHLHFILSSFELVLLEIDTHITDVTLCTIFASLPRLNVGISSVVKDTRVRGELPIPLHAQASLTVDFPKGSRLRICDPSCILNFLYLLNRALLTISQTNGFLCSMGNHRIFLSIHRQRFSYTFHCCQHLLF